MRSLLIFIFVCFLTSYVRSQLQQAWPLNRLSYTSHQYATDHHSLLSTVRFTSQKTRSALINYIRWNNPPPDDRITMKGLARSNYRDNRILTTIIDRDSIEDLGGSERLLFLGTGSQAYGINFETDATDNYYVIFDLVCKDWTPQATTCASLNDSTQLLICKYNLMGQLLWYKKYGGSSAEYAVKIKKTHDGNMLILAETQSNDGDVSGAFGGKDIWLIKINAVDGSIIWKKTVGSDKNEIARDMEIMPDGSIMISGTAENSTFAPSSYAGYNAFLQKLDVNGNLIWTQVFGGDGNDAIAAIFLSPNGVVSQCSSTSSNGDFPQNVGGTDIYIMSHNSTGNIIWKKNYGNFQEDEPGDIVYVACENRVFASYAKQFSNNTYYNTSPPYPLFSQRAGVRVGLYLDGTEFFYLEDAFGYTNGNGDWEFNERIFPSLDTNDRGGICAGAFTHLRWGSSVDPSARGTISRSYDFFNYGFPLRKENIDTSICKGNPVYGINYFADTTLYDTLRNQCNVDTLITKTVITVINADDSTRNADTLVCYGQLFEGQPLYNSFTDRDTTIITTICGPKSHITLTNVIVSAPITATLGPDTTVCPPGNLFNVLYPGANYLWSTGSLSPSQFISSAGSYWVQITDSNGCKKIDSITVNIDNIYLQIRDDTAIQSGQSITLFPQSNGIISWQADNSLSCFNCPNPTASPGETTTFYVNSIKGNCLLSDSIRVIVNKGFYFYVPTAFTPNNDGLNDLFGPIANLISVYSMTIYNRWGQKIFHSNNLNHRWNGKISGMPQDSGVFVYVITFNDPDQKSHFYKGTFVLIR